MARTSTPQKGFLNLRCHEYCGGSEAVCYCPQCSAIFCNSCYDREHEGSARKQSHERLVEVRPICQEHQHTLEYFDLTSLKPICITCLTNLQSRSDLQDHVIKNINEISTRLCSLLDDKVLESKEVLRDVQDAAIATKETTKRTLNMTLSQVHDVMEQCRDILDDKEQKLKLKIKRIYAEFLGNEAKTGYTALANRLEENIKQADSTSDDEKKFSNTQFPYFFTKLDELCSAARKKLDDPKEVKITLSLSRIISKRIERMMDISTEMVSPLILSDNEEEDAELNCSRYVKVVIVPENRIPSPDSTFMDPDTSRTQGTGISTDQPYSPDQEDKQNKQVSGFETPVRDSKPFKAAEHGNHTERLESPGIHSNQSEDLESPGNYSNWSPKQNNLSNTSEDELQSPRIHGDWSPRQENVSIHGNQDEELETPTVHDDQSEMPESPCNHGNHHVTKETPETSEISEQVKIIRNPAKNKGRKRKRKPALSEEEWTPTRTLRPSTMQGRKRGTEAKPRSRRGGELNEEMNRCDAILTILWADEDSWPFVHLIDKKRCPEYYKKIRNPVSLEIMKQRLHSYQYRSVLDFVRDFNHIIENCQAFNKPDTDVYQAGTRLATRFNNLLRECFPNIESVFQDQDLMDSSL